MMVRAGRLSVSAPGPGPAASPSRSYHSRALPRRSSSTSDENDQLVEAEAAIFSSVSSQVYSLSTTCDEARSRSTMNLVTYCTSVGLRPRTIALSLFVGTLSWENFKRNGGEGVLQVLNTGQVGCFDLLGRKSGRDVDKIRELEALGVEVREWRGFPIMAGCSAALLVRATNLPDLPKCGDHELALCEVEDAYLGGDRSSPLLTTAFLREHGIL